MREPLFQFGTRVRGTSIALIFTTGMPLGYRARRGPDLLTHRGGHGQPVVLVHGLMGRGSTWSRQLPWLTRLGTVYTYDAPWHRAVMSPTRTRSAPSASWPTCTTR
ncbi:putative hydrolase [Mycobacterium xenopi 4042]|uniref:Putative hydrolase n=1 Tax=Mycobacterium xenopi 4042 TaxID=1299334 RepID=X7ZZ06_MYCXE|nr:putative hydrolase [Mycobacterium xenopi 4042]